MQLLLFPNRRHFGPKAFYKSNCIGTGSVRHPAFFTPCHLEHAFISAIGTPRHPSSNTYSQSLSHPPLSPVELNRLGYNNPPHFHPQAIYANSNCMSYPSHWPTATYLLGVKEHVIFITVLPCHLKEKKKKTLPHRL